MQALATTKMSSKGQIVIPEDVRQRLHLKTGDQFIVVGEDDVVILKTIHAPSMSQFDSLIKKARREARTSGMTQSDITQAIKRVRKGK